MQRNLLISVLVLFLFSLATDSFGQRRKYGMKKSNRSKKFSRYSGGRVGYSGVGQVKYWTLGLSINTNNYFGDIAPAPAKLSTDYKFIPNGIGLTYSRVMAPGIFLRAGFNWGRIEADDFSQADPTDDIARFRYARNFQFRNDIKELSVGFELDLIPSNSGARGRFPINPYGYIGAAVFHHAPKAIAPDFDQAGNPIAEAGQWVDLKPLGTEGQNQDSLGGASYSNYQFAIPFALGVKIRLHGNLDLNIEFGFRYLFFDHIDDISGGYANLGQFPDTNEGYLGRALTERGAETVAVATGDMRNPAFYSTNTSGVFTVGENYAPGTNRGNPDNNDFYTTTAIRLVYIFDRPGQVRGKYR